MRAIMNLSATAIGKANIVTLLGTSGVAAVTMPRTKPAALG
jgi:hypothetical protein